MVNDLDYEGITCPVSKKDYCKIEVKNNICINVFCYENNLVYPVYISNEKFENCTDLLMISKILTDLCAMEQKIKIKSTFASIVYNVLVVEEF